MNLCKEVSAQKYLFYVCITLFLFILIVVFSLFYLSKKGITESAQTDTKFIATFNQVQAEAREAIAGNSLCIIGGSGSLYSISACELSRILEVPVVNFGLHAGLGLEYLLYRAKKIVKPGDVVVLLLEEQLLSTTQYGWTVANFVIPYDLGFISKIKVKELKKFVSLLTLHEYLDRIYASFFEIPIILDKRSANKSGDLVLNLEKRQNKETQWHLKKNTTDPVHIAIQDANLDHLKSFIDWANSQNIKVLAGYPAISDHPYYQSEEGLNELKKLKNMWETLNVQMVGERKDFIFPLSFFYDHVYHMHSGGKGVMTDVLARLLRPFLVETSLATVAPSSEIIVDFVLLYPFPCGVLDISGIGKLETWGVWTESSVVTLELSRILPADFTVTFSVENLSHVESLEIKVEAGGDAALCAINGKGVYSVSLKPKFSATSISLHLPKQLFSEDPSSNNSHARIGLSKISITPRI